MLFDIIKNLLELLNINNMFNLNKIERNRNIIIIYVLMVTFLFIEVIGSYVWLSFPDKYVEKAVGVIKKINYAPPHLVFEDKNENIIYFNFPDSSIFGYGTSSSIINKSKIGCIGVVYYYHSKKLVTIENTIWKLDCDNIKISNEYLSNYFSNGRFKKNKFILFLCYQLLLSYT